MDSRVLCECGCGQPAPIAKRTNSKRGQAAGQPVRYIFGHKRPSASALAASAAASASAWLVKGPSCPLSVLVLVLDTS